MAKNQNKRLDAGTLEADIAALNALQTVTGYAPANPAYALTAVTQTRNDLRAAQAAEDRATAALKAARDQAAAAEWAFHNFILGVKEQAIAQYGKDSVEVQSLGLKRKSEYKSRGPKKPSDPK